MTSTITPSAPPAGWYADATGPGMHYWDGDHWADPETTTLGAVLSRGSARWAAALAAARTQPLWKRRWFILAGLVIVLIVLFSTINGGSTPTHHVASRDASHQGVSAKAGHQGAKATGHAARSRSIPNSPEPVMGRTGAVSSAGTYLDSAAFSRPGLIDQLRLDGYSTKDALFAVNSVGANWNGQAAKSAKAYLALSSFTREGLISQLEFEGFTEQQAYYGASKAGF